MKSFASLVLVVSSSFVLAACGTGADSFCDQVCACTGCSEAEKADCVDNFEDGQKVADEAGCSDQFDAAVSCAADELECSDSQASVDGCTAEGEELGECAGKPIAVGTNGCDAAIQRIVAKLESCGLDVGGGEEPGEQPECTTELAAQAACFDGCYSAASCEEINGQGDPDNLNDCLISCSEG